MATYYFLKRFLRKENQPYRCRTYFFMKIIKIKSFDVINVEASNLQLNDYEWIPVFKVDQTLLSDSMVMIKLYAVTSRRRKSSNN